MGGLAVGQAVWLVPPGAKTDKLAACPTGRTSQPASVAGHGDSSHNASMSQTREHPLEAVLHLIAAAAPEPWRYQQHARQHGFDPAGVETVLELLWLEGLIRREGATSPEAGPGVGLTPFGQQVLGDPELLQRLRNDEPLTNEAGAIVRDSLRRPVKPVITRLLLIANFAVFGYCIYLARQIPGMTSAFLGAMPGQPLPKVLFTQVLHPAGSLNADD